jgi:hypothetical protein
MTPTAAATEFTTEPPGTATPGAARTVQSGWPRLLTFDNRYLAPILITIILFGANWQFGILDNLASPFLAWLTDDYLTTFSPTFAAILSALGMELVLGKALKGRWPMLASAYISGISAGILIKSSFLWPYALCAMISIASKYALRVRGRHLWNPTNFGVTVMLALGGNTVAALSQQSGNNIWPVVIIWTAGAVILGRLGRLHIPLSFAMAYVPLAYFRSQVTGDPFLTELAPLTGPMYQLFMCFMITDPPTTPRGKWNQCLVAVLVAVAETVLRLNRDIHAAFHALFIVGPIANLIEIGYDTLRKRARAVVAAAR